MEQFANYDYLMVFDAVPWLGARCMLQANGLGEGSALLRTWGYRRSHGRIIFEDTKIMLQSGDSLQSLDLWHGGEKEPSVILACLGLHRCHMKRRAQGPEPISVLPTESRLVDAL